MRPHPRRINRRRKSSRPRDSRLLTVPTGQPNWQGGCAARQALQGSRAQSPRGNAPATGRAFVENRRRSRCWPSSPAYCKRRQLAAASLSCLLRWAMEVRRKRPLAGRRRRANSRSILDWRTEDGPADQDHEGCLEGVLGVVFIPKHGAANSRSTIGPCLSTRAANAGSAGFIAALTEPPSSALSVCCPIAPDWKERLDAVNQSRCSFPLHLSRPPGWLMLTGGSVATDANGSDFSRGFPLASQACMNGRCLAMPRGCDRVRS